MEKNKNDVNFTTACVSLVLIAAGISWWIRVKYELSWINVLGILTAIFSGLMVLGQFYDGIVKIIVDALESKEKTIGLILTVISFCIMPFVAQSIYSFFLPGQDFSFFVYICTGAVSTIVLYSLSLSIIEDVKNSVIRKNAYNTFEKRLRSNPVNTREVLAEFLDAQEKFMDWKKVVFRWRPGLKASTMKDSHDQSAEYHRMTVELQILAEMLYGEKYFDSKLTRRIKKQMIREKLEIN